MSLGQTAFKPSFPNPVQWTPELILARQKEFAAFQQTPVGLAEQQEFDAEFSKWYDKQGGF